MFCLLLQYKNLFKLLLPGLFQGCIIAEIFVEMDQLQQIQMDSILNNMMMEIYFIFNDLCEFQYEEIKQYHRMNNLRIHQHCPLRVVRIAKQNVNPFALFAIIVDQVAKLVRMVTKKIDNLFYSISGDNILTEGKKCDDGNLIFCDDGNLIFYDGCHQLSFSRPVACSNCCLDFCYDFMKVFICLSIPALNFIISIPIRNEILNARAVVQEEMLVDFQILMVLALLYAEIKQLLKTNNVMTVMSCLRVDFIHVYNLSLVSFVFIRINVLIQSKRLIQRKLIIFIFQIQSSLQSQIVEIDQFIKQVLIKLVNIQKLQINIFQTLLEQESQGNLVHLIMRNYQYASDWKTLLYQIIYFTKFQGYLKKNSPFRMTYFNKYQQYKFLF
ncbi:unnamed protein product [Paramecium primaurelia]|uniref:Uncharacterized protein n=1 Tax=Paramecium primaurelia TaxID=5886 RepID=A0A8S1QRW5_PARPR|nr:unnamed protein product [Paramecium primaurelia]